MWNDEKAFGKYVMSCLKAKGMTPVRIESASTISGMPDMFVMGYNNDCFIELKNMKQASILDNKWRIHWRPGQQAWGQQYIASHSAMYNGTCIKKCSWTFVGLGDGILLVRMSRYHEDSIVECRSADVFPMSRQMFSGLDLPMFLMAHSHVVHIRPREDETVREWTVRCMEVCLYDVLGTRYDCFDIPAPDDYIDELDCLTPVMLEEHLTLEFYKDHGSMLERQVMQVALSIYTCHRDNYKLQYIKRHKENVLS